MCIMSWLCFSRFLERFNFPRFTHNMGLDRVKLTTEWVCFWVKCSCVMDLSCSSHLDIGFLHSVTLFYVVTEEESVRSQCVNVNCKWSLLVRGGRCVISNLWFHPLQERAHNRFVMNYGSTADCRRDSMIGIFIVQSGTLTTPECV